MAIFSRGRLAVLAAVIGTLALSACSGLQVLGGQSYMQQLFYGGALLCAVALSQLARGRVPLETN